MAKLPRNLDELKQINSLLSDATTKLQNIAKLGENALTFNSDSILRANSQFTELERHISNSAKIAPKIAEGMKKILDVSKEVNKLLEKNVKLKEEEEKIDKKILDLGKVKSKKQKEQKARLEKEKETVRKSIEENNDAIDEGNKKLQNKSELWKQIAKTVGGSVLNAVDRVATAGVNFGLAITSWSFDKAIDGISRIYDFQERSTRALGTFRLEMGAMTQDIGVASKTAGNMEGKIRALTGGDVGEGFKAYGDFAKGVGFLNAETDKFAQTSWELGRATGAGTEGVAQLYRNISIAEDSFATGRVETEKFMKAVIDGANEAGVSTSEFSREILGSQDFMAQFGKAGRETFIKTATYVKKLGISLKSLEAFTNITDNFDSATQAAAKMNTVFGTSVSSLSLMLEEDPSKRFEMVREQMKLQGIEASKMSRREIKFLAQTLNISEQEIQAALREGKTIEEVQAARDKANTKKESQERTIRRALSMTAQTLFNFKLAWDSLTPSITKAIAPLAKWLGLAPEKGKEAVSFGQVMTKMFDRLRSAIDKLANNKAFQSFLVSVAHGLDTLMSKVDLFLSGNDLDEMITSATETLKTFYGVIKSVSNFLWDNKDMIIGTFKFIADHMGLIIGLFVGAKFAKMGMGIASFGQKVHSLVKALGLIGPAASATSALAGAAPGAASAASGGASVAAGGAGIGAKVMAPILAKMGTFASFLSGPVTGAFSSVAGALGAAGLVAAAGAAGWALGRFVGSLEVGGKTVDTHIQDAMLSHKEWTKNLDESINQSSFGEFLGLNDERKTTLTENRVDDQKLQQFRQALNAAAQGGEPLTKNWAELIDKLKGNDKLLKAVVGKPNGGSGLNLDEMRKVVKGADTKNFTVKQPISPNVQSPNVKTPTVVQQGTTSPSVPGSASVTSNNLGPNRAIKTVDAASKEVMMVQAGDVYLDGQKVGAHLVREGLLRGIS